MKEKVKYERRSVKCTERYRIVFWNSLAFRNLINSFWILRLKAHFEPSVFYFFFVEWSPIVLEPFVIQSNSSASFSSSSHSNIAMTHQQDLMQTWAKWFIQHEVQHLCHNVMSRSERLYERLRDNIEQLQVYVALIAPDKPWNK